MKQELLGVIIEGRKKRRSWRSNVEAPYRYWRVFETLNTMALRIAYH
jgi:hypothetical protein